MSTSKAALGAVSAGLLILAGSPASAQPVSGSVPEGYLGEVGEMLPGSVTGSLPGYASGPVGSAAYAVCNLGTAAGWVGLTLPELVRPVCMVAPAIGRSVDQFVEADYTGSVKSLIGGVPYVGSILVHVVPTESAVEVVEGSAGQSAGGDSAGQGSDGGSADQGSAGVGTLSVDSLSSELPGS